MVKHFAKLIVLGLFLFFATGIAEAVAASSIPGGCVSLGPSRKVSNMCDFKDGVPMYYTKVWTNPIQGCPNTVIVQYQDPSTNETTDWAVTRSGTTIETCQAGVNNIWLKPDVETPTTVPNAPAGTPHFWNAVAGGIWHDGNGDAHVSAGYSGAQPSEDAATSAAISGCEQSGGQNCHVVGGAWDFGCVYITVGHGNQGVSWGSGTTLAEASKNCTNGGYQCQPPIGGCVN